MALQMQWSDVGQKDEQEDGEKCKNIGPQPHLRNFKHDD